MNERVDIRWLIFEKIAKIYIEVVTQKSTIFKVFRVIYQKRCFSVPVTLFLTFL